MKVVGVAGNMTPLVSIFGEGVKEETRAGFTGREGHKDLTSTY